MPPLVLTREQSRQVDRLAIEEYGFSGLVLMENAGRGVADVLCRLGIAGPVVVCCGKGNNAGDGFVIARHLDLRGHAVRVLLWAEPEELTGDAAANFHILAKTDVPIEVFGAATTPTGWRRSCWTARRGSSTRLLGTGARGEPRPPLDAVIDQTQRRRRAEAGDRPAQRTGLRHGPARPAHDPRRRDLHVRRRQAGLLRRLPPSSTSAACTCSTSACRAGWWSGSLRQGPRRVDRTLGYVKRNRDASITAEILGEHQICRHAVRKMGKMRAWRSLLCVGALKQ